MSAGAIWGSLSSTQKALAVVFLLVNVLMLGAVAGTLGFIYTNTSPTPAPTPTPTSKFNNLYVQYTM